MADKFWIRQILDILICSNSNIDLEIHLSKSTHRFLSLADLFGLEDISMQMNLDEEEDTIISKHVKFLSSLQSASFWVQMFPILWKILNKKEQNDIVKLLIPLLCKEYHSAQNSLQINVIQAILEGIRLLNFII